MIMQSLSHFDDRKFRTSTFLLFWNTCRACGPNDKDAEDIEKEIKLGEG